MMALIPSLRDCKFRALEFLTFLLKRSSLKSFAFSTKEKLTGGVFTVSSFSCVMAARIKQICMELVLKQLSNRVPCDILLLRFACCLWFSGLGLSIRCISKSLTNIKSFLNLHPFSDLPRPLRSGAKRPFSCFRCFLSVSLPFYELLFITNC
jgi:hypothetical protein